MERWCKKYNRVSFGYCFLYGHVKGIINKCRSGGRKIGQNKLLSKNPRFNPYAKQTKCAVCKRNLQVGMYCQQCAYKKGLCSMCGVQILDVKNYKQTTW